MTEQEALAGLRILVAVARADGTLDERERDALARALAEFSPATAPPLARILAEPVDFDAACAAITSPAARRAVFAAAVAMSLIDQRDSDEERRLIDRLRAALELQHAAAGSDQSAHGGAFASLLSGERGPFRRTSARPEENPELRRYKVAEVIRYYALWTGLVGAVPVPLLDGIVVGVAQLGMLDEIAMLWGRQMSGRERLAAVAGALGLNAAIIAAASVLKLVPGWGSAFGAASAYASTYTLGRVFEDTLEHRGERTKDELRAVIARARAEARRAFEGDRAGIEAARVEHAGTLEALTRDFQEGRLSAAEFEQRVAALHADAVPRGVGQA